MGRNTDILAGSHLPILIAAVNATAKRHNNAVLEVGMGLSSTPVLHWLCTAQKRQLLSLENDPNWHEPNKRFENQFHKVELISDWDKAPIDDTMWSVALIDHRPALRRKDEAIRLKNNAYLILLHDSEEEINRFYRYDKTFSHFKYRHNFDKLLPNTLALSNFIHPTKLFTI